jgi:hypothetical protein
MSVLLQPPPPPPAPVPEGWEGLLDQGETILWQGAPDKGIVFSVPQIPEMLLGLVFAVVPMGAALDPNTTLFSRLFTVPFMIVGLGIAMKSNILASLRRRGSHYTLTNRRAIIATRFPFSGRKLASYPISASTLLHLEEAGEFGTILFHRSEWRDAEGDRLSKNIGFERISEPRRVFSLMRQIQQEAK